MVETVTHMVVAPKLGMRAGLPDDWQEQLTAIPGVTLLGAGGSRIQIMATAAALATVNSRWGGMLHVEPSLPRGLA